MNIVLKPSLKEGEHFMIVDEFIWDFLYSRYKVVKDNVVQRFGITANDDTGEAIVELYLRKIMIFPIPN